MEARAVIHQPMPAPARHRTPAIRTAAFVPAFTSYQTQGWLEDLFQEALLQDAADSSLRMPHVASLLGGIHQIPR